MEFTDVDFDCGPEVQSNLLQEYGGQFSRLFTLFHVRLLRNCHSGDAVESGYHSVFFLFALKSALNRYSDIEEFIHYQYAESQALRNQVADPSLWQHVTREAVGEDISIVTKTFQILREMKTIVETIGEDKFLMDPVNNKNVDWTDQIHAVSGCLAGLEGIFVEHVLTGSPELD